jgi:hypothetical protein
MALASGSLLPLSFFLDQIIKKVTKDPTFRVSRRRQKINQANKVRTTTALSDWSMLSAADTVAAGCFGSQRN